jgi:hypothetical protein
MFWSGHSDLRRGVYCAQGRAETLSSWFVFGMNLCSERASPKESTLYSVSRKPVGSGVCKEISWITGFAHYRRRRARSCSALDKQQELTKISSHARGIRQRSGLSIGVRDASGSVPRCRGYWGRGTLVGSFRWPWPPDRVLRGCDRGRR